MFWKQDVTVEQVKKGHPRRDALIKYCVDSFSGSVIVEMFRSSRRRCKNSVLKMIRPLSNKDFAESLKHQRTKYLYKEMSSQYETSDSMTPISSGALCLENKVLVRYSY
jgi:hypothetical protein